MPAVVSMQVYDQKVRFVSRSVSRVQHLCSPAVGQHHLGAPSMSVRVPHGRDGAVGLRLSLDSTRAAYAPMVVCEAVLKSPR